MKKVSEILDEIKQDAKYYVMLENNKNLIQILIY